MCPIWTTRAISSTNFTPLDLGYQLGYLKVTQGGMPILTMLLKIDFWAKFQNLIKNKGPLKS